MRYWLLPILLGLFSGVAAQSRVYKLDGTLGVESGETFIYKMIFTDSAGKISGHTVTFMNEGHDVKASLSGTIDPKTRTIAFRETGILENNGFYSVATICLVQARLKYTSQAGKMVLIGGISSFDASNASCTGGSISLSGDGVMLQELFTKAAPAAGLSTTAPAVPDAPKPKPKVVVVYDTAHTQPAKPSATVTDKVTQGKEKVIEWLSDEVMLDIWDGGKIDNDIVNVLFNGEPVLKKYVLVKDKKQLRLPLSGNGVDIITIFAVNEGNESPNTANIILTDGDKEYPVIAYNDVGKEAVIRIRKKK